MSEGKILLVDDEPNILKTMSMGLKSLGFDVSSFSSGEQALGFLDKDPHQGFTIAFIDLMMHPMNGITLMQELQRRMPGLTVVIITAHGTVGTAVEAMKLGAYDYLQKPFDYNELESFLKRVSRSNAVKKNYEASSGIITEDQNFQIVLKTAEKVARTNITVLIEGETGVGKELVADLIQKASDRADKPYIKLNCAALSEELIESELFGHAKGAFTGAVKDRIGMAEAANSGTIFLDEIGELPMLMQAKLLRFLQNREFYRVGENTPRTSDVRIIAATNRNLEEEIERKGFREDLFYRLSGFRLLVPPLRHRKEDILPIAESILERFASVGKTLTFSDEVKNIFKGYTWRGNVRELENVVIRAAVLSEGEHKIGKETLPLYMVERASSTQESALSAGGELRSLEDIEHDHIAHILSKTKNLEEAAKILGIDSATLWRKRKKFGL
jgi:NtrC-family two-component system response regulator AlgB